MAVTQTPRFTLPQWSSGTDQYPGRTGFNEIMALLEEKAAIVFPSGLLTNRPAGGTFGRFYLATDQGTDGRLYYDGGSGWIELNTNGGGGPATAVAIDGSASEGTSNRSARADHVHTLPLATAANHGALSAQHYDMLDRASSTVVNGALIRRTSGGHVYLPPTGQGAFDAIHKDYVDMATEDLRLATAAVAGTRIVKRWSDGSVSGPDPTKPEFYTTKRYVDDHTWPTNQIRDGVWSGSRIRYSSWAYNTAWNGSGAIRTVHVTNGHDLCYYSSTGRHKTNIEPWALDPRAALAVEPVEFDRLDPDTGEPTGVHDYGVHAEKAGKHLPMFLEYGQDGRIEGWSYLQWTTAHQVVLRWLAGRADSQAQEIAALKDANRELKERMARIEEHLGLSS